MADRAQWERREQGLAAEVAALQAQLEAKQTEQVQCSSPGPSRSPNPDSNPTPNPDS